MGDEFREADLHYFFEAKAIRLQLSLENRTGGALEDVRFLLALPRIKGLKVADQLYAPPGEQRTRKEMELLGYPDVKLDDKAVLIRCEPGYIGPDECVELFETPPRLAVRSVLAGRRIRMQYQIKAANLFEPVTGKLTLAFSGKSKA